MEDFDIYPAEVLNVTQMEVNFKYENQEGKLLLKDNRWAFPNGGNVAQLDDFRKIIHPGDYILVQKLTKVIC